MGRQRLPTPHRYSWLVDARGVGAERRAARAGWSARAVGKDRIDVAISSEDGHDRRSVAHDARPRCRTAHAARRRQQVWSRVGRKACGAAGAAQRLPGSALVDAGRCGSRDRATWLVIAASHHERPTRRLSRARSLPGSASWTATNASGTGLAGTAASILHRVWIDGADFHLAEEAVARDEKRSTRCKELACKGEAARPERGR